MQIIFDQAMRELKGHPYTLVIIIGLIGFAWFGWNNFARAEDVDDIKTSLATEKKVTECRWLSDKIERAENQLYVLERDGGDRDWINEKSRNLVRLKDRYKATTCAIIKY